MSGFHKKRLKSVEIEVNFNLVSYGLSIKEKVWNTNTNPHRQLVSRQVGMAPLK
jgi:hypothetical protein